MIGSVVVGKKPWNNKYNVGLVVDEADDVNEVINRDKEKDYSFIPSYKVLWTTEKMQNPEDSWEYKLYGVFPKQEVCYTWEVSESLECISFKCIEKQEQ